ncbi:phytoene desaturase [Aquibium sp. ELW1220]|uniref:phytoene desaturase n=1 Tax=Aquibium sp. ELW1220 TaxID=2976766 RepID=UPI0025B14CA8|nr:phytoene desaturase [Aquibium sp. ELW1220]MDN2581102.1 phytoene desaturase [Aquibium sp. ELW1220]
MLTSPDRNRRFDPTDRRPHAVVIGSGFGGLAAAVRLGARGFRVTVLERLERIGGRASVLSQDGFTFDRGPTIVTAPFLFEELWTLAGRRMQDDVDLRPLDPFYRIRFDDGSHVDCWRDADAMRAEVARAAPDDVEGWDRFMAMAREICRVGFEQLGHKPFSSFADMLRIAPDLIRLEGWRSVHGLVSSYVRSPKLRTVLSFHPLLIGGNPFRAPAIYCLIPDLERRWGVHYPIGGVGRLVDGLAGLIAEQGGIVRTRAEVAGIETKEGRATGVRLASGERIAAEIVVSNADAATTYGRLLDKAAPRRWSDRKIARARHSMGLLVWYFGTRGRFDAVGHHTILLGPRYKGLIEDVFERKRLTEDFSIYLHRPSASDPAVAPAGCDAFYALTPVPNLQGDVDWTVEAERRRAAIERRLEETLMPGLSGRIVTSKVITPVDFRDDYLSAHGAGFGFEPVLTQSAWFRPHNRSETIRDLFLVGAGTHPGAGLPGVLSSARILDTVVPHASAYLR